MKKLMKKSLLISVLILFVSACTPGLFTGNWENTISNEENTAKVITTLTIIEKDVDNFTATMTARVEGKESDTLKVTTKSISFSGYIRGKILYVNNVDEVSDYLSSRTSLRISESGKYLTLSPGSIKFNLK